MGTRSYVEELEYSDAKGLDTASPINLVGPGYVREAVNVNLGLTGGYIKRSGYVPQLLAENQLAGFAIINGIQYRVSDGNPQLILHISDKAGIAQIGKVNNGVFNAFTDKNNVSLDLDPFTRGSMVQVKNGLYFFDSSGKSFVPFVYEANGVYTRSIGIKFPEDPADATKPDTPVAATTPSGPGAYLNEGQYIFAYTYAFYYNDQLIAESSPSNPSNTVTVTPGNQIVDLNVQAYPFYGDSNLSHLTIVTRIWRTVANGSILFLESEEAANITTYTSTTVDDALLSEQLSLDNSRIQDYVGYERGRFPVVVRNRIFVFHENQNRVRFSKVGFQGPLPESFPVVNEVNLEGKFGAADSVTGAGQVRGVPIVLKERSIGRLEEVGLPDLGNSEDNVIYTYREISEVTGAVSHHAQCQVFDELIFLGRDNIYGTDGQNVRPIASSIQNIIKASNFDSDTNVFLSAINDTQNKRVYFQIYKTQTSLHPDLTLVGDYQQYPNFRWTTYESGPDEVDAPGLKVGSFFAVESVSTGAVDTYFGSSELHGQYYLMNSGTSDYPNGVEKTIYMRLVSRPYMFSQPMITKLYKRAKIYAEAQDNTYTFSFGAKFDLDVVDSDVTTFNVSGVGTVWGNSAPTYEWTYNPEELNAYAALQALDPTLPNAPAIDPGNDPLLWTGPALQEFTYNLHRKAEIMQLVFLQNSTDAPLTLLGWGVSGSIFSGL